MWQCVVKTEAAGVHLPATGRMIRGKWAAVLWANHSTASRCSRWSGRQLPTPWRPTRPEWEKNQQVGRFEVAAAAAGVATLIWSEKYWFSMLLQYCWRRSRPSPTGVSLQRNLPPQVAQVGRSTETTDKLSRAVINSSVLKNTYFDTSCSCCQFH